MKRGWLTYVMVGGLAVLLLVLGALQYRWMTQISESDGEKAKRRVKEQAERFAADFNREVQNAYFNFQTDAAAWKAGDWAPFNERYEFWRKNSGYPDLISDVYFFQTDPAAAPMRYDQDSKTFTFVEANPEIDAIRARAAENKDFRPVDTASYAMLLPIHEPRLKEADHLILRRSEDAPASVPIPPRFGTLAVKLDQTVVKDKLLNDLTSKYFGEGDYRVAIADVEGAPVYNVLASGTPDASAPLFDLSPDNFVFFSNKDLMRSIGAVKREGGVVTSHVESRSMSRIEATGEGGGTVEIKVKREPGIPRTAVFTATTSGSVLAPPWILNIQHSSGSIDGYIASTLRRNLTIGFGILFLLAAAVAAILISTFRARALAQRQLDFVSSVSHEFRTPLAVIYSAGENLADGVAKEDAQVSSYGSLIKGEGKKLTAMVEQILDFAGAKAGRRTFSLVPTQVGEVVNEAIEESRTLIEDRGFEVETAITDSLAMIAVDKGALSQAVQNLVANAVKYSNGSRWLRIAAANGDGHVKISVEDRGIGISKAEMRRIFEPFYRSQAVVDAQIHGNGLGLSLVKQIVDAHGGRVFATSEIGKGSKFTIELPQKLI